jgi:aerobic carbon-monoxide dehydrogenase large subunit
LRLLGNLSGDGDEADFIEERFIMETITANQRLADAEMLEIEAVTANPALQTDRRWAIRFNAGGTVTIVLGMRDYGRGWFSAYFAGLAAARLGIPFGRIRIYYSANLPAALRTPVPSPTQFRRSDVGPVAGAAADIIEQMCDHVIEQGRLAFTAMAGIGIGDVGFDQSTGRFFVLDRERSGNILDLARAVPRGFFKSTGSAMKRQAGDRHSITATIPSAA